MTSDEDRKLTPYLSPIGAWALALGTSIGWGSLVITSNTYLSLAGPFGSVLGITVGALIMLVISRNYHYMMNCCPSAGGAYAYARDTFGYDHGFLVFWFLMLTYLAMLWANATALPLFARYFMGDFFEVGRLYTLFGYEVYFGEALLTIAVILVIARLCSVQKKVTSGIMVALVGCFIAGISVCFLSAVLKHDRSFSPAFIPETNLLSQVLRITVISPWAFIGFENISHATEEFTFRRTRSYRILVASVITTTLLYIFLTLLSSSAYPARYDSWLAYIRDVGNLEGIEALPAFYAAQYYLGPFGVFLLMLSLMALVLTSLIGNTLVLSRLFYTLAKDHILPERYAVLTQRHIPENAIRLIAITFLAVPFIGRTAIGWIVDITTVGATLVYGYVSACTIRKAIERGDRLEEWTGRIGAFMMIGFALFLLLPNLFAAGSMAAETYFLLLFWSVLGFLYFGVIFKRDRQNRFGQSVIVWIALLSMVLFVALVWMNQSLMDATAEGIITVEEYYKQEGIQEDIGIGAQQWSIVRSINIRNTVVVLVLFGGALGVVLSNYSLMRRRAKESEAQLGIAKNLANTDILTGVKSKRAFSDKEAALNAEIAAGSAPDFAIAVCDVNGLKYINDTFGHQVGDEYLRSACRMICEIFSHSPVYRTGGDEFVVYLQRSDYQNRHELMEMLHTRSRENINKEQVVVSGGFADYLRGEDLSVQSVFDRADAQMYGEKQRLKELGARIR